MTAVAAPAVARTGAPDQGDTAAEPLGQLLAELDAMTGLAEVKSQVRQLIAFLRVQTLRRAQHLPGIETSKHLVFLGNPGTRQDDDRAPHRADLSLAGAC